MIRNKIIMGVISGVVVTILAIGLDTRQTYKETSFKVLVNGEIKMDVGEVVKIGSELYVPIRSGESELGTKIVINEGQNEIQVLNSIEEELQNNIKLLGYYSRVKEYLQLQRDINDRVGNMVALKLRDGEVLDTFVQQILEDKELNKKEEENINKNIYKLEVLNEQCGKDNTDFEILRNKIEDIKEKQRELIINVLMYEEIGENKYRVDWVMDSSELRENISLAEDIVKQWEEKIISRAYK